MDKPLDQSVSEIIDDLYCRLFRVGKFRDSAPVAEPISTITFAVLSAINADRASRPAPADDVAELVERLEKAALPLSLRQMETNEDGLPTIPGDGEGLEAAGVMREAAVMLRDLSDEKRAFLSGEQVVLPNSKKHAEDLYAVAIASLRSFGSDPEARLSQQVIEDKETLLLRIFAAAGGTLASDDSAPWLAYFTDETEVGKDPDTFNTCHDLGWLRTFHDTSFDTSTTYLTEGGRLHLEAVDRALAPKGSGE